MEALNSCFGRLQARNMHRLPSFATLFRFAADAGIDRWSIVIHSRLNSVCELSDTSREESSPTHTALSAISRAPETVCPSFLKRAAELAKRGDTTLLLGPMPRYRLPARYARLAGNHERFHFQFVAAM